MSSSFEVIALSPPGFAGSAIGLSAMSGGASGGAALEHSAAAMVQGVVETLAASGGRFTLSVGEINESIRALVNCAAARGLDRVILCDVDASRLREVLAWLRDLRVRAWVQATRVQQAEAAQALGADGVVVKGNESGGLVGEETSLVLLQRVARAVSIPILVRGGVGLYTAAACLAGGAVGAVLDWQLALCEESEVPEEIKTRLRRMDGSETAILGQDRPLRYRAYARPGESAYAALKELDESGESAEDWRGAVESRIGDSKVGDRLLLIGQDAAFAAPLAGQFRTVAAVCRAIRGEAVRQCRAAAHRRDLRPDGPLAESHGTRFPILQGPMTRVSDTADFALSVARGGGLPFLALALLRGPQVAALLEETKLKLADKPWGIGILGFVPKELRDEQLAEVRKHPPPYAIIAGGRPDQAAELEREGIHTYLHVPSPGLLALFLQQGARRVIFEGRECGGHVGPRTSFVLWDSMIRVILSHLAASTDAADDYHVIFAGGIHDATSASMVAAMAAPLSERGVRVGVLLGTGYLFTQEAVQAGAILKGFQDEALRCNQTILLETGVGHSTRCADTAFGRQFAEAKQKLTREGRSKEEIREALETLNLGRLRIASKGVVRGEAPNPLEQNPTYQRIDDQTQRREGMYMIGQVAALRDRVCTIAELHADVSEGGVRRLERFASKAATPRREGPCDVAIIGMECLFAKAGNLQEYWRNILNKVSAIGEVPAERWDSELYFDADRRARDKIYSRWGGFLDPVPFDPTRFGMPPNSVASVEPLQLMVLEVARRALEDAGYADRPFDREHTSVIIGAGGGVGDVGLSYGFRSMLAHYMNSAGRPDAEAAEIIESLEGQLPEWTEDSFAGLLLNVAAGRVANRLDLGGTNYTVDAACASSLAAVRLAVNELQSGSSNMVLVGGADTMQSPFAYLCFSKTQALSPTGRCRTFDESGDGIVISEGIAVAVLKRLEDAERDGDRIYAVIKGVGSSSDGRDKGLTAPRPEGQIRALKRAYEQAGFTPDTVGLVEAHGTGTVVGDRSEVESLTRVYHAAGADPQSCALGSVKSMIGHTKCTAGVAGLLKAALALHHKVLPPTLGVTKPNPKANFPASPFYVNAETRPWIQRGDATPRRAAVSAFGFGGTNFHAVLEEYAPADAVSTAAPSMHEWPAELFIWRAGSPEPILRSLDMIERALQDGARPALRDLAAAVCRAHAASGAHRLAILAGSLDELRARMSAAGDALQRGDKEMRDPKGIYYSGSAAVAPSEIAFMFPGQGSQSVNMLRELAVAFPSVRRTFEEADHGLGGTLGRPLSRFVFPRPAFSDEERAADETALTQTRVAQPAMGAADMALYGLLSELGIRPAMMAGHSYGEYAALCAAGALGFADLIRVSEGRGRFIAEAGSANPGAMAAVSADEASVAAAIEGISGVSIANLNAPGQTVISGTDSAVEEALARLAERKLAGKKIKVSCAFHSPLVTAAQGPFAALLGTAAFSAPRVPVYSNTTAAPHTGDAQAIRTTLVEHLARPVRFVDEVLAMHGAGARLFIEVGPGRTLTGLVEQILKGKTHAAVAMDQPGRGGLTSFLAGLAHLAAAGVPLDAAPLFAGRVEQALDLDKLVAQTKSAPLSPTTWMLSGALAQPVNGKSNGVKPKAEPVAAKPAVGAEPAPIVAPAPAPVSTNRAVPAQASHPAAPLPAVRASGPGMESVMTAHQQLMTRFLDMHKNVMLAYLGNGHVRPASAESASLTAQPVMAPPAAPIASRRGDLDIPAYRLVEPRIEVVEPVSSPGPRSNGKAAHSPAPSPTVEPVAEERPIRDMLTQRLTQIVADRTGYPPDMLDLDLDLEADLGIDSIKRIEILGALQKDGVLPQGGSESDMEVLSKLKTLRAIVDKLADSAGSAPSATAPVVESAPLTTHHSLFTLETGKMPVLRPAPRMTLEACDCPLPPADEARPIAGAVVLTNDANGIAELLAVRLRAAGHPVEILDAVALDLTDEKSVRKVCQRVRDSHGRVGAVVALHTLAAGASSELADWPEAALRESLGTFNLMKELEADLRGGSGGRVLAATRLGGTFACVATKNSDFWPGSAGVCGLVKSLAREWPEVHSKAVDFDSDASPEGVVAAVLNELRARVDFAEVGYVEGRRVMLRPRTAEFEARTNGVSLDEKSVVLITGGARGVTAESAIELAQRCRPTLVLVGRSTLPAECESADTSGLTDAKELKARIRAKIEQSGEKATPATIESAYRRLMQEREIRASLAAMRAAGSKVEYHAVDVADASAFGALIDELYARHGRLDGVIHGAGVIEDKLVKDKTPASFQRVFSPKVSGAITLARKLRGDSLKFLAFFSSVSARYGNRGQADYAAANEVMNKLAHWLAARWPAKVVTLNWGPWESTGGMVSAELAKQFEAAGVHVLSRAAGRKACVDEILHGPREAVEVIFGGPLSAAAAPAQPESRVGPSVTALLAGAQIQPESDGAVRVTRILDPSQDYFLLDHQLDGKPVMPMAMMLEFFAEIAASRRPDLQPAAVRELRVLKGISLDNGPSPVNVWAKLHEVPGGVDVELRAEHGDRRQTCFTAFAELRPQRPTPPPHAPLMLRGSRPLPLSINEAYEQWLFHGPIFAGIEKVEALGENGIIAWLSPSSPQRCLSDAPGAVWLIDPVIVDSGLQLMILWARTYLDMTPLPSRLGCYHGFDRLAQGDIRCETTIRYNGGPALFADLKFYDRAGKLIGWVEDMEGTCSKALNRLAATRVGQPLEHP